MDLRAGSTKGASLPRPDGKGWRQDSPSWERAKQCLWGMVYNYGLIMTVS